MERENTDQQDNLVDAAGDMIDTYRKLINPGDRGRAGPILSAVRPPHGPHRNRRPDRQRHGEHRGPDGHRPGHARPRHGPVHDGLHGRYATGGAPSSAGSRTPTVPGSASPSAESSRPWPRSRRPGPGPRGRPAPVGGLAPRPPTGSASSPENGGTGDRSLNPPPGSAPFVRGSAAAGRRPPGGAAYRRSPAPLTGRLAG